MANSRTEKKLRKTNNHLTSKEKKSKSKGTEPTGEVMSALEAEGQGGVFTPIGEGKVVRHTN